MLKLSGITKDYKMGDMKVEALRGVDLEFRESEFVAVLGPSGCGKTTLLNIIGGLDRYSSGDLSVNGKSTKKFRDGDWDAYRNRSVGFVFQSYNLIPHQTVLSNVELALTLSGVSKKERRERAKRVLDQVGLSDQLHKKPTQMSGGQMQRVAIARALINDPEILLADEPTGALDSETSTQVMEILREIAKDRLIIMVTHNPDLAGEYSNRTINLLDGHVIADSNPYTADTGGSPAPAKPRKTRMSFKTALALSLNNLMTKKGRTFLTAFAGSIGIIGIALILSLSNGFQAYIDRVQEDTLSSYPIVIQEQSVDLTSMIGSMMMIQTEQTEERPTDRVYSAEIMSKMLDSVVSDITTNNIGDFKQFVEDDANGVRDMVIDIKYSYSTTMNLYNADTSDGVVQVLPNQIMSNLSMGMNSNSMSGPMMSMGGADVFAELVGGNSLLEQQYDVLAGHLPNNMNEAVLIINRDNEVSDYMLYSIGLRDRAEVEDIMKKLMNGETADEFDVSATSYSYDELLGLNFKLMLNTAYYQEQDGVWKDMSDDEDYMKWAVDAAPSLSIVGIIRPNDNSAISSENGSIGYRSELMDYLIEEIDKSEIVGQQRSNPDIDVFTGIAFPDPDAPKDTPPAEPDYSSMPEQQYNYLMSLSEEERAALLAQYAPPSTEATYDGNLAILGVADPDKPSGIRLYPKDFESKEKITDMIADYNRAAEDAGKPENVIQYNDIMGLLMSSVSTIINAISYVLIAFVAISLVVSSIMIGIITYISVLERTKEIGILRSIGASKGDISSVFNAETLLVGFTAGAIGIGTTLLLTIPANLIISAVTGLSGIVALPWQGGLILVGISMVLTFVAGLIPARIAAGKDPVEALRSE